MDEMQGTGGFKLRNRLLRDKTGDYYLRTWRICIFFPQQLRCNPCCSMWQAENELEP